MTLDKGQKLEHLWKIKKSPADTICGPKQRTCLGKPGWVGGWMDRYMDGWINGWIDSQTDRWMDRQRQTDR
jgi:hypothetical protein